MAGNIERVTLAIAEAVDHCATVAAFLTDGLAKRLSLAPVSAQIAALCDYQCLSAGGQHLRLHL